MSQQNKEAPTSHGSHIYICAASVRNSTKNAAKANTTPLQAMQWVSVSPIWQFHFIGAREAEIDDVNTGKLKKKSRLNQIQQTFHFRVCRRRFERREDVVGLPSGSEVAVAAEDALEEEDVALAAASEDVVLAAAEETLEDAACFFGLFGLLEPLGRFSDTFGELVLLLLLLGLVFGSLSGAGVVSGDFRSSSVSGADGFGLTDASGSSRGASLGFGLEEALCSTSNCATLDDDTCAGAGSFCVTLRSSDSE